MINKILKLDAKGIDHIYLAVSFIVVIGTLGSLYFVLSSAASATVVKTGLLSSGLTNSAGHTMCLDDFRNSSTNGTSVNIYPCNTADTAQKWSLYSDNTIRIHGKCLDVYQQGKVNGSKIDLYICNGGLNQRWAVGTNPKVSLNNLESAQSGLCLDVYSSNTANSSPTDLWQCDDTNAQVWGWNTGSTVVAGGDTRYANCTYLGGQEQSDGCYAWVGALQNNNGKFTADGVSANFGQWAPICNSECGHSLVEFYASDMTGKNTVEFGWNVPTNGTKPKLGVGLWVNGNVIDANSNFVQVSSLVKMGQNVIVGATANYKILFQANQWQIYYNGTEVGYFPESIWTSRGSSFTQLGNIQMFGEVLQPAFNVADMQMGNGKLGSASGSAQISNYTLYNSTTPADLQGFYKTSKSNFYDYGTTTSTGFYFGGPGVF